MAQPPSSLEDHLRSLKKWTATGGPLAPGAASDTTKNPENFRSEGGALVIRMQRAKLHKEILDEYFAEHPSVLCQGRAIICSGPPGAGKSSVLRKRLGAESINHWRIIDPDEFKDRLLRKLGEKRYGFTLPNPDLGGASIPPGELAALIHEESSLLAKRARQRAIIRKENVVIDGLHSSEYKLKRTFQELTRRADRQYSDIEIILVDTDLNTSRARVTHRFTSAYLAWATEGDTAAGYAARYVPEEITNEVYHERTDRSACTTAVSAFLRSDEARESLVKASFYRVDHAAGEPRLVQTIDYTEDRQRRTKKYPRTPETTAAASQPIPTNPTPDSASTPPAATHSTRTTCGADTERGTPCRRTGTCPYHST